MLKPLGSRQIHEIVKYGDAFGESFINSFVQKKLNKPVLCGLYYSEISFIAFHYDKTIPLPEQFFYYCSIFGPDGQRYFLMPIAEVYSLMHVFELFENKKPDVGFGHVMTLAEKSYQETLK